jgi:PAS domain S-box-containing protein
VSKNGTNRVIFANNRDTVDRSLYVPSFEAAAWRTIVQSVPHAIVLIDGRLRIALVNRAAGLLLGRAPAALHGLPVAHVLSPPALNVLLQDAGTKRVRVLETSVVSDDRAGSMRTLKITAVPLANGKVMTRARASDYLAKGFTLLVIEDISEQDTLEQQLVDGEKQAAMGQLAAGLLHEVSNPLTSLGSNLLFVRKALPAATDAQVVQALDASLDQLEQMRQLLGTLSSLPGRATPRYELADLHHVMRQCVTFIAKDAEQRHISLVVAFSPAPATCEMDVRLIKQVLLNLLKNAMEAMPQGGRIAVKTTQVAGEANEPPAVEIEIADTGIGIAEADLRRVFRPLFSTKRRGAGLGLSFCRQTVEEHGGAIRVSSPGKDQGCTVVVSLPTRQLTNQDD